MALPGEEIQQPRKQTKLGKRTPQSDVGKKLAESQARESQASQARLNSLMAVAEGSGPPEPAINQQDIQPLYNDFQRADDISDTDENQQETTPVNRAEFYRGVTYQERTLREESDWKKVFPKMFLAFMPCSRTTFQWTHPDLWKNDMNESCNCASWQKKEISIDAIDWASESYLTLSYVQKQDR